MVVVCNYLAVMAKSLRAILLSSSVVSGNFIVNVCHSSCKTWGTHKSQAKLCFQSGANGCVLCMFQSDLGPSRGESSHCQLKPS